MSDRSARLRTADRTALSVLCLLLIASASVRIYAYQAIADPEPAAETIVVDLGAGVSLSRPEAVRRLVPIASCLAPAAADFVEPSPHGSDTSLAAPPDPNDRVFYAYQGWMLDGPRAALKLNGLYFMRRAGAVLGLGSSGIRHELAVKLILPAGCDASPDAAMASLRQEIRAGH